MVAAGALPGLEGGGGGIFLALSRLRAEEGGDERGCRERGR